MSQFHFANTFYTMDRLQVAVQPCSTIAQHITIYQRSSGNGDSKCGVLFTITFILPPMPALCYGFETLDTDKTPSEDRSGDGEGV